jgi:hypothetical protein
MSKKSPGVRGIIGARSDADLARCASEIKAWRSTCVLPEGIVREIAKQIQEEVKIAEETVLRLAEDAILMEAAERFMKLVCGQTSTDGKVLL